MKKIGLLFFLVISVSCKTESSFTVKNKGIPQNPSGKVVVDLSEVLSPEQRDILTNRIIDFEQQTTNEIAILTTDSIAPFKDISSYSSAVGNLWGVGKKDKNNGLVIVLRKHQREIQLTTGYSTEKILTDSICQDIIDNTMVPQFKEGQYYQGFSNALDSIMRIWH